MGARGFHTSPLLLAAWTPRREVLMQPGREGSQGTCRRAGLLSRGVTPRKLLAALWGEVQGQGKSGLRWSSGNRQKIRFMQPKQLFIKNFKASRSALWMSSGREKKQMSQAHVLREDPLCGFCLTLPSPYLGGGEPLVKVWIQLGASWKSGKSVLAALGCSVFVDTGV